MEKDRGKLISLEGPEGAGKSQQLSDLAEYLRGLGISVYRCREPGGTKIGEQVRDVLHDLTNDSMHPRTEALLFQSARAQLIEEVLKPLINRGDWVLLDRFFDSTLAYQGYGHGLDLAKLMGIIEFATDGFKPDLTLLLDVDVETGLKRKRQQGEWTRLDGMDVEFHKRVYKGYQELFLKEPERWRVIDANKGIQEVREQIQEVVTDFFGLKAVGVLGINGDGVK